MLTRRRADLRRHAGEISFPGGRRDPDDADLTETALREAEEEIGLARVAGAADRRAARDLDLRHQLPDPSLRRDDPGRRRLGAVAEGGRRRARAAPSSDVRAGRTITTLERRGFTFQTDAYVVGEHLIWGATARIIEHLLERIADEPGRPLALHAGP